MNLQEIDIITPEQVTLKFKIAGIGSRATAQLIDWFILVLLNFTIFFIAIKFEESFLGDNAFFSDYLWATITIVFFILTWGYFALFEFFSAGRTFGKWAMGIRVIQDNGQSITFLSSFLRNLLRIVDFLPALYFLGMLMIFLHAKHKRIGDLVAGTIVIYEHKRKKKAKQLDKELVKRNIDQVKMDVDDWSKKKITAKEWNLLKTYVDRRRSLSGVDKEKLTYKVASVLFPIIQRDMEGQSPEQLETDLLALYMVLKEDWEF
jgi:uncharacterized RDD family membrane protein YckC